MTFTLSCSQGWLWTCNSLASISQVLRFQAFATLPGLCSAGGGTVYICKANKKEVFYLLPPQPRFASFVIHQLYPFVFLFLFWDQAANVGMRGQFARVMWIWGLGSGCQPGVCSCSGFLRQGPTEARLAFNLLLRRCPWTPSLLISCLKCWGYLFKNITFFFKKKKKEIDWGKAALACKPSILEGASRGLLGVWS